MSSVTASTDATVQQSQCTGLCDMSKKFAANCLGNTLSFYCVTGEPTSAIALGTFHAVVQTVGEILFLGVKTPKIEPKVETSEGPTKKAIGYFVGKTAGTVFNIAGQLWNLRTCNPITTIGWFTISTITEQYFTPAEQNRPAAIVPNNIKN